ncbi:MAG: Insulinase (Peptidase family M16) [Verrucomicrobia bacterium ADurb.Bin345]|nr:MAG: Insulinase (Peptidase family M16) [Verrucomicrobia bacterium ADurb.Bin345]
MNVKVSSIPNGIRVATAAMDSVESVAMGVWVAVGGRHEPARLAGISHFIEHLLFKGTRTRSARDISRAIEGRGGYFNAFTQEESTCYYARVAAEHRWPVFDILADMYLNPRFAADDINRERGVIMEEISMYKDQPHHLVQELLGELLWWKHPLGRALIGTEKTVRGISRADILGYKRDRYLPGSTVVIFAGKVDHDQCVEKVQRLLGRTSGAGSQAFAPAGRQVGQKDVYVLGKDIEQTHLAIGVRVFGRYDRRRYALKLLSIMLGENMSSRLFQVVREKHGLAYSVHSSMHLYADTGVLDIAAGVDTKRMSKAVELILREVALLKEKLVGAQELRRAKDYAIGQLRIGLENTGSQMMWVGENLLGYGKVISPDEVVRRLEAVDAGDIREVARQVLHRRNTSAAMITPGGGKAHAVMLREHLGDLG